MAANTEVKKPGRIKTFFKGVWGELKKVHWPDRKQLAVYTGVVIIFVLIISLVLSALDWTVMNLFSLVLS